MAVLALRRQIRLDKNIDMSIISRVSLFKSSLLLKIDLQITQTLQLN
jgi:hypothetical protein